MLILIVKKMLWQPFILFFFLLAYAKLQNPQSLWFLDLQIYRTEFPTQIDFNKNETKMLKLNGKRAWKKQNNLNPKKIEELIIRNAIYLFQFCSLSATDKLSTVMFQFKSMTDYAQTISKHF